MAYVVIHVPNLPSQKMKLLGPTVVGRAFGCQLWIDDGKLSRQHCRIEPRGDEWFLVDMHSSNGTFIDGQRIAERKLHDGVAIEVGHARVVFREGDFVSNRPADPLEAATRGSSRLTPISTADSTLGGTGIPTDPKAVKTQPAPPESGKKAMSLAFTRPPAAPKVGQRLQYQTWLQRIASWFGRG